MSISHSGSVDCSAIYENIRALSAEFTQQRHERQRRRHLDAADFIRLQEAGFLRTGVPVEHGGIIESISRSTRPITEMLRALAQGDSSVALVAAMHPAVLYVARWPVQPEAPLPYTQAWEEQRQYVFQSALEGHWWGTITSEPASGGDMLKTRAVARRAATAEGKYRLSGQKHFGSGSGIMSFMVTSAIPEGEDDPDWFFLDMRGVPWDGSAGVTLVAEWDGHGMTATQSHAMQFDDFPATRVAHPGSLSRMMKREDGINVGFIPCLFTAVIVGIVEVAIRTARERLDERRESLNAYEQVEWTKVQQEAWLIEQAYEGMLRGTEEQNGRGALRGKVAVAELAESALARLCRVMGGGSYARHSPFGFWFEDVRALGFLRPPWPLAYATLQTLTE